jgi:oligopeptide/dipeptide ABC transporter ATP-binding protein
MEDLLRVEDLSVEFRRDGQPIRPVRGVSLIVQSGECVALVGESGCGKSLTALALTHLPPTDRAAIGGRVFFLGRDLLNAASDELRQVRGRGIAYVFQDPANALNPVMRIGDQIAECLADLPRADRASRVLELLTRVKLPDPARCARAFSCELSGGMQQRAMLAVALANRPRLLVADEPTTALDVLTQREVLNLTDELARAEGLAVLLITHNLGLVAGRAARVYVMYGGMVVESGPAREVLSSPFHPYTRGLRAAVPSLTAPPDVRLRDIPGVVPAPDAWPAGCPFAPRCNHPPAAACHTTVPRLNTRGNRQVRGAHGT